MPFIHDTSGVLDINAIEPSTSRWSPMFGPDLGFGCTIPDGTRLDAVFPGIDSMDGGFYLKEDSGYTMGTNDRAYARFTDSTGVAREVEFFHYDTNYWNIDGSGGSRIIASNIVWEIPLRPATYTITQNLTNATSDCTLTTILPNTSLTVTLTPSDGFEFVEIPTCSNGSTAVVGVKDGDNYVFTLVAEGNIAIYASAAKRVLPNNANFGFMNIYNPTLAELQTAANAWFYSMTSGTVDVSRYVVALFRLYATPLVMEDLETIKFANHDTNVMTRIVREPITVVDCGEIIVPELYNNALDYSPNTTVRIFLPFIGFENLDIDIIMNTVLSLEYRVDVLSGKCIAKLTATKDEVAYHIYTFTGDCSMQIPYYFNDGAAVNTSFVTRPYNLDDRTPFLLIERAIPYMPESSQLEGVLSNELVILGDVTGYTKCKEVNVHGMNCTSIERAEIEELLKKGVIL